MQGHRIKSRNIRGSQMTEQQQEIWAFYIGQKKPNGKAYHYKRKPTEAEKKLIARQLRSLEDAEALKHAIEETHLTPWNTGENPTGKKYLSLSHCISDDRIGARLQAWQDRQEAAEDERQRQKSRAIARKNTEAEEQRARIFHAERIASGQTMAQLVKEHKKRP